MAYYQFKDEYSDNVYGSCEVYYMSFNEAISWDIVEPDGDGGWIINNGYGKEQVEPQDVEGWYWQACFPGCLPDGEPSGPFKTEEEAMDDANVFVEV